MLEALYKENLQESGRRLVMLLVYLVIFNGKLRLSEFEDNVDFFWCISGSIVRITSCYGRMERRLLQTWLRQAGDTLPFSAFSEKTNHLLSITVEHVRYRALRVATYVVVMLACSCLPVSCECF